MFEKFAGSFHATASHWSQHCHGRWNDFLMAISVADFEAEKKSGARQGGRQGTF
jgi:hypothetical protein